MQIHTVFVCLLSVRIKQTGYENIASNLLIPVVYSFLGAGHLPDQVFPVVMATIIKFSLSLKTNVNFINSVGLQFYSR